MSPAHPSIIIVFIIGIMPDQHRHRQRCSKCRVSHGHLPMEVNKASEMRTGGAAMQQRLQDLIVIFDVLNAARRVLGEVEFQQRRKRT
jgi:hypothetical protein